VGDDRFVPGLARLVDEVRRRSGGETLLFLQVLDFLAIRRRPEREKFLRRFLRVTEALRAAAAERLGDPGLAALGEEVFRDRLVAATDEDLRAFLPPREWESLAMGYRERVTDLELPHVRDLPKVLPGLFASASRRAAAAGFDGVELHFAHAYTMASFLSATNTRDDGWGGARENRVRLPLDVLRAARAASPADFVVGCRMLGDEVIEGGNRAGDAAWFATQFAEAGIDFVSLSKGGKFDDAAQPKVGEAAYPYTGPSGHECMPTVRIDARGPFGRNLPLAAAVRAAIRAAGRATPVVAAGGISSFEIAEAALARGDADFVAAARQSLADPDWWEKVRRGRGAEVRRCEYTNYCEALDQHHLQVTCRLWDRLPGTDAHSAAKSADGGRRLLPPPWQGGASEPS
jgi:hypothetical protein